MPLLEVEGLVAGYGDDAVVNNVDLEVGTGEVVALLGANGAGKTTTLLTMAGELPVLGGVIRCLDLPGDPPLYRRARAGLALVTDGRSIFMRMTVADNLRIFHVSTGALLHLFPEFTSHLEQRVALLSGGQQQMLSLGLAISRQPRVILADELSLGLAPNVASRLLSVLRVAADSGVGVVLVEQHVHRAMSIADRVYVMDRGRIVISGTADELRGRMDEIQYSYLPGRPSSRDVTRG